jgi:hypothetical protein
VLPTLIAIAVLGAAPASARPKRAKHAGSMRACSGQRKHSVAMSKEVIVYKKPSREGSNGALTTYYACLPPAGMPLAIGQSEEGGEYPGEVSFSDPHISGTYVADLSGSGFAGAATCGKYAPAANCEEEVKWWVEVAEVRTRRRLRLSAGVRETGRPTAVAVSSAGAVAWVQPNSSSTATLRAVVLHDAGPGRLTRTVQTLDTGNIGRSLAFSGLTLHWTSSGQAKTQALGPANVATRSRPWRRPGL